MPNAENLKKLAADELTQLREEGCEVEDLQRVYDEAIQLSAKGKGKRLEAFFHLAQKKKPEPDFEYHEPSKLDAIRDARPNGPRKLHPDRNELTDRILGAWLGRCVGCMLGKPVEGWSKDDIEKLLKFADAYPLDNYFPPLSESPEDMRTYNSADNPCLRGQIDHSVRDDDTDYTLLGLHIMENYGAEFSSEDVAAEWLQRLPYHRVYTAERCAYRNLVNDIQPPESAAVMNPYREWIGAQIRCDAFAYCAPGWPEKAAEFGFRDAAISHVKNGIYGEMFFAALISACMACDDLDEAITIASAEIPDNCRLAEAIDDAVAWAEADDNWRQSWRRMDEKYGHYHRVHTINNALIVLIGCLHADGEFERAICNSVMCGLDTDCTGATAGSVMGAIGGVDAIPDKWAGPLNDTLESALQGMNVNRISNLAARTADVAVSLRKDD